MECPCHRCAVSLCGGLLGKFRGADFTQPARTKRLRGWVKLCLDLPQTILHGWADLLFLFRRRWYLGLCQLERTHVSLRLQLA